MIKGVSKKVLEINNPQSLYFEKAVLYLKPNLNQISYKLLRAEAEEMLGGLSVTNRKRKSCKRLFKGLLITFAVSGLNFLCYSLIFGLK